MTVATMTRDLRRPGGAVLPTLLVLLLLAVGLVAGWLLRTAAESATSPIERGGITMDVPAGWLIEPASGDLLLLATDPTAPDSRVSVARIPAEGRSLADVAAEQDQASAGLFESYRVISQGPVRFAGKEGHEVRFALVDSSRGDPVPRVIEGLDEYIAGGDAVLRISIEAHSGELESVLPAFYRFAESITQRAGTGS